MRSTAENEKITQLSRDPFARGNLVRASIPAAVAAVDHRTGCHWCGGHNRHGGLFRYGWDDDSYTRADQINWSRPYCCVSCFRAYNG